MSNRIRATVVACLLSCSIAGTACAEQRGGAALAANCTGCHGPNGRSEGAIPALAGLARDYFIASMNDFKTGQRTATVMHQHAKGYSDSEIALLAEYFAKEEQR